MAYNTHLAPNYKKSLNSFISKVASHVLLIVLSKYILTWEGGSFL